MSGYGAGYGQLSGPQIARVTADPRSAGLNMAQGTVVTYVNGGASTLLIKTTAAGGNAYAWRRINERYILPESSTAALGLLGLNVTSMYKPGPYVNSCPDLVGANHLAKSSINNVVTQAVIDSHQAHWYSSATSTDTADVLDPAAASFWHAVVFALPGGSSTFPSTCGIASRFDGSAFGWGLYWNSSAFNILVKDTAGNSTGALLLTTPALNPQTSPGSLYLAQIVVNRTGALLDVRLSKAGAAPDLRSAVSIAAVTGSLTKAAQSFGYGAANAVVAYGAAVAWGAHAVGAQIETGQTVMAAVESALGFAA